MKVMKRNTGDKLYFTNMCKNSKLNQHSSTTKKQSNQLSIGNREDE